MTKQDEKWNVQRLQLVEFEQKKGHCEAPRRCEQDKSLGAWVSSQRTNHIDKELHWTKSGSLGKITAPKPTSSGTRGMKSLSSLNERRGIVWCHASASKTLGLWVPALLRSRPFHKTNKIRLDQKTACTKSGSIGKLKAPTSWTNWTNSGTSSAKRSLSLNERMAIVWSQNVTSKTSLWGAESATSGPITSMTKFELTERDCWTKSGSLGKLEATTTTP
jgi:hypothetical protein